MRLLVSVSLAAIAAVIACTGVGSGADLRTPRPLPVVAGYNLTAEFSASLFVSWAVREGDRNLECNAWAETSGLNKAKASTVKPVKGFLQIFRRGLAPRTRRGPVPSWGNLVAVGRAKGTVDRSLDQQSGVNGGAGCGTAKRFPPTSCGERSFTTRTATLLATWRVFDRTLDPREIDPSLVGLSRESIDFSVAPARDPYSACEIPRFAWGFPVDVGLRVDDRDWNALRALKRKRSYQLRDHYGGRCSEALPARDCSFVLDLSVTIRRI